MVPEMRSWRAAPCRSFKFSLSRGIARFISLHSSVPSQLRTLHSISAQRASALSANIAKAGIEERLQIQARREGKHLRFDNLSASAAQQVYYDQNTFSRSRQSANKSLMH